jgi:hypothetical protein
MLTFLDIFAALLAWAAAAAWVLTGVCTETLIRADAVMESPKLAE